MEATNLDTIRHSSLEPLLEQHREPSPPPSPESTTEKTVEVSRSLWKDKLTGLCQSRFLRSLAFTAVEVGVLFLLLATPPGWLIATVVVGAFVLSYLTQIIADRGMHKAKFEWSALIRFGKSIVKSNESNFNAITIPGSLNSGRLILGALPNRATGYGENLVGKHNVGTVFSLNESWERTPFGVSCPYTNSGWAELGVTYKEITTRDHHYLSFDDLNEAADFINTQLTTTDKNVYVHCRAGHGRSAMAIAAYLIKYEGKTADEAAAIIKASRDSSSITKKLKDKKNEGEFELGLRSYEQSLQQPISPPRDELPQELQL